MVILNIAISCFIISVPPDGVQMLIDGLPNNVIIVPGEHQFECITGYSTPASSVTWSFGNANYDEDGHTTEIDNGLISTRSMINRDITTSDCNIVVTCTATNDVISDSETDPSTSVTLKVNGMYVQHPIVYNLIATMFIPLTQLTMIFTNTGCLRKTTM